MKPRLLTALLVAGILSACNACSKTQTTAIKDSIPADLACIGTRLLSDQQAGMSWEAIVLDIGDVCGEAALQNYESDFAALAASQTDAGIDAGPPFPSPLATYRRLKAVRATRSR